MTTKCAHAVKRYSHDVQHTYMHYNTKVLLTFLAVDYKSIICESNYPALYHINQIIQCTKQCSKRQTAKAFLMESFKIIATNIIYQKWPSSVDITINYSIISISIKTGLHTLIEQSLKFLITHRIHFRW